MNYDDVYELFIQKQCILLEDKDDFMNKHLTTNKQIQHMRVHYKASCGHENYVTITNFKLRNTGILCSKCVKHNTSSKLKNINKNVSKTEVSGFNYISDMIKNSFDIIKTKEGCEADLLIRPLNILGDNWLKIQLKITQKVIHNMYSFSANPYKYNNDVIYLFVCEKDNKIWCIEKKDILHLRNKLNISLISKYNKYLCNTSDILLDKLSNLYNSVTHCNKDIGLIPKNIYINKENKNIHN